MEGITSLEVSHKTFQAKTYRIWTYLGQFISKAGLLGLLKGIIAKVQDLMGQNFIS